MVQGPRSKLLFQAWCSGWQWLCGVTRFQRPACAARLGCRAGPRSASPAHFGAKLFDLAWPAPKARKPFALYVMENSLVKPGAAKSQYQAELKRLGQAWKDLHQVNRHTTTNAAWQSLRLKGKQSCLLGRREAMTRGRCPMSLCLAMTNPTNFGWALTR